MLHLGHVLLLLVLQYSTSGPRCEIRLVDSQHVLVLTFVALTLGSAVDFFRHNVDIKTQKQWLLDLSLFLVIVVFGSGHSTYVYTLLSSYELVRLSSSLVITAMYFLLVVAHAWYLGPNVPLIDNFVCERQDIMIVKAALVSSVLLPMTRTVMKAVCFIG